jgi:hypothetical protein
VLTAKDPEGLRVVIPESELEGVKATEIKDEVYVLTTATTRSSRPCR